MGIQLCESCFKNSLVLSFKEWGLVVGILDLVDTFKFPRHGRIGETGSQFFSMFAVQTGSNPFPPGNDRDRDVLSNHVGGTVLPLVGKTRTNHEHGVDPAEPRWGVDARLHRSRGEMRAVELILLSPLPVSRRFREVSGAPGGST